ncbi:hypothetical protein QPL79_06095 [Ignisphaera sp. 4213-co]|uniref:DUF86 domain-containing protein n=1 Tax=Ignisphaera cupida TaxID=3050454 RepID=A0ABD4Z726_9CREN|nr:hypothetical protein [Ignisphaera sp. 4213-co]MDK6028929.1 hypothetical protein [Ignisphaera sp. 4213-co]
MLHKRLLEIIAVHTDLLEKIRERKVDWDNILELYSVLHTLQIHAQAIIDYLLHTCAIIGVLVSLRFVLVDISACLITPYPASSPALREPVSLERVGGFIEALPPPRNCS